MTLSLDLEKNVSGVSAVTNSIVAYNGEFEYEHFLLGRSDRAREPLID